MPTDKARPPPKEEEKKREEKRMAPADKNVAFQEFKNGVGSEVNQKKRDNDELLKEKKKLQKVAGERVNSAVKEIENLKVCNERQMGIFNFDFNFNLKFIFIKFLFL
jgi:hypothetical protein